MQIKNYSIIIKKHEKFTKLIIEFKVNLIINIILKLFIKVKTKLIQKGHI